MSAPLLEVRGLAVEFARGRGRARRVLRAVDGIDLDVAGGECVGLVGESGSGKSTLARALVGLERTSAGSVRLGGAELTGLSPRQWLPYRRRIQLVFQDPYASLDPRQTALAILEEPLRIHALAKPRERRLRAAVLLDAVGLSPGMAPRRPHELSGGQRQRLAIARALAVEPELLVCDEPVSALDVSVQAQIVNLLADLRERFGLALLFIAHDLAVVRHLADRVAVMYLGRIAETGARDLVFAQPLHPYTQALLSAVPIPDPELERARARTVLPGDPPSPFDPPAGCAFHPRCPARARVPEDLCARERPELLAPAASAGRAVACHLLRAS